MSGQTFYHGGKAGLSVGDLLVPAPPHVEDGCPICVARAAGRSCTVGEYRRWIAQFGQRAEPVLRQLRDQPDSMPMDPPSAKRAVYITTSLPYATYYAARSGHGDLYRVKPLGPLETATEDHFESYTVDGARVLQVLRREVHLTREERRRIMHLWKKADARTDRRRQA